MRKEITVVVTYGEETIFQRKGLVYIGKDWNSAELIEAVWEKIKEVCSLTQAPRVNYGHIRINGAICLLEDLVPDNIELLEMALYPSCTLRREMNVDVVRETTERVGYSIELAIKGTIAELAQHTGRFIGTTGETLKVIEVEDIAGNIILIEPERSVMLDIGKVTLLAHSTVEFI